MSITKSQGHTICRVGIVTQGTLGEEGGLSKAHHSKLRRMFPGGPQHTSATGPSVEVDGVAGVLGTPAEDGALSYAKTYRDAVMRGLSTATLGGEVVDMSYGTTPSPVSEKQPPDLQALNAPNIGAGPEKESLQGQNGSTISVTGLGPNVNPLPEDDISARTMVDVKAPKGAPPVPFAPSTPSPSTTSADIVNDSVALPGVGSVT